MKQEPMKKWKLPKYAAVIAALTVSAGMLNGCGKEPLQTEGTAPAPVDSECSAELMIAGDMVVETEPETAAETESAETGSGDKS